MSRYTKSFKIQLKNAWYQLFTEKLDEKVFQNTFLTNLEYQPVDLQPARPIIYCFWTGDNSMSQARQKHLNTIYKNADVEVQLVTAENLHDFLPADFQLHRAYHSLSLVHRSDYLRCCFMHHLGGGYMDIKKCETSWKSVFSKLNASENLWLAGYTEYRPSAVAPVGGTLQKNLEQHYPLLVGNGAFICKPYTPLTTVWWQQLNHILDEKTELLLANPGNVLGDNAGYPLAWTEIMGQIFHPTVLRFREHVLHAQQLRPSFVDYR
ncbi:MAG: capsular polysaccharide synthesis protein [Weeksellaceae bacterium]|nr:capsular polysaccharide synthesis protein [Weeksellaceae bacterium]